MSRAAKTTAPAALPEATHFRTKFDESCTCGFDEGPSALLVNPAATLDSLLGAILSRVHRLQVSLDAWCVAGNADVQVQEVVGPLEPLAEEALQLLRIVQQRVALAGRQP